MVPNYAGRYHQFILPSVLLCMYGLCHHYSCTVHCSIAFQTPMYTAQSACVTVADFNASSVYLDRQWVERSLNKRAHIVYTFFNKRQLFLRGLYCQFRHSFCELSTTLLLELPCPFTAAICVCGLPSVPMNRAAEHHHQT